MPMEGHKNGSLTIRTRIWLEVFFLYREINNIECKFWVNETLDASYSQAVIAWKMG